MMDKFEKQFEQLDVQTQVMDETMSASTTLNVPQVSSKFIRKKYVWEWEGLEKRLLLSLVRTEREILEINARNQAKEGKDYSFIHFLEFRH